MSKITFENESNIRKIRELNNSGFPDCEIYPMTQDEIKDLKIGDACYIINRNNGVRLMMFLGYLDGCKAFDSEFRFCCYNGEYDYKTKNVGKTYNVFRARV